MKETVMIPIGDVIPYEHNPRKNKDAVDKVAASLREFGFRQPIVVDKDNVIIAGHTRLLAAKKLKMKEVPVLVADDLTEEQVKAYRLADNKTAEFAEWDTDLLNLELDGILDIDMEQFGFDLDLDDEDEDSADEIEEDEFTDDVESRCKVGDIWQLGAHRLICGDSTDVNVIDKLLDGERADLLLTDPPYGVKAVESSGHNDGKKAGSQMCRDNKYEPIIGDDTTDTARASYDVALTVSDNQIIFGGNYFTDFLPPSRCWIVWDKKVAGSFADGELAWTSFDKNLKIYEHMWSGMRRAGDRNVEGKKRVHPTQKPVGLIANILYDFTAENTNVLDLFGGSGSTLIACEQTGRRCFMAELSEHYCDVIINRWEQLTGQEAELLQTDSEDSTDLPF